MSKPKRKFAAFDIDGTIFRWQLYHELFDAMWSASLISPAKVEKVFAARESWAARTISFRDYEILLVDCMEVVIQGLPEQTIHDLANKILDDKGKRIYTYTRDLLRSLKKQGYFIIAISGSHQQLVEPFAKLYEIDLAYGSRYEMVDGIFGKSYEPVLGKKGGILKKIVTENSLTWDESYAVGDSGGDAGMLELVTHPIAFNPDEALFKIAQKNHWKIVIERKSMIYELEVPKSQEGANGTYLLAQTNTR